MLVGLIMDDKGVLRHGQRVVTPAGDGEILSGGFSPTIGKSIAFARMPAGTEAGPLQADIRGKLVPVRIVKYPFVRDGQPTRGRLIRRGVHPATGSIARIAPRPAPGFRSCKRFQAI